MTTEQQHPSPNHAARSLDQEKSRREHAPGFGEEYRNDRYFGENRFGLEPGAVGSENSIREDDAIRNDILDLLQKDPQLDHWGIHVEVKDGTVVLTGHVEDHHKKTHAEFVLNGVQGILEVRNELQVHPHEKTLM